MSNEQQDGMYILGADIEHFKNLKKVLLEIGGKSFYVFGGNGKGKSSFIQALLSPMDTKLIPAEPIMEGEERSSIEITIGGRINNQEKKYIMDLYFTPGNKKGRLVVTDILGETVKSPATLLKSILGNISFDIFKFLNDTKAKKIQTLKELSGEGIKIDLINKTIGEKKARLKTVKEKIEESEALLNTHKFTDDEITKYSVPFHTPMETLQEEMSNVSKSIDNWKKVEDKVRILTSEMQAGAQRNLVRETTISNHKASIQELLKKITEEETAIVNENAAQVANENLIKDCSKWFVKYGGECPSAKEISDRIADATLHAEKHQQINDLAEKQKSLIALKTEQQTIGIEITKEEGNRGKLIAGSKLPVKGLSFDDEEIFIEGLPLDESQISKSRLFDIGTDIAMALNPVLKTIFLHDGSLFDRPTLDALFVKCKKKGYQVIAEVVDWDGGELELRFAEKDI